jgi:hypothetical protein
MPTKRPTARPGWSGVEKLDLEFPSAEFARLIELIPITRTLDPMEAQNRGEQLSNRLIELKARFQRHLHQDEFGPRRADQVEGLRSLLENVERLAQRADDEALDQIASLLDSVDTNAIGEFSIDASEVGLDITSLRKKATPQQRKKKLLLLTQTLHGTIDRMSQIRGADKGKSVGVLISQLATLWKEETGVEPTASSEETYRTEFESFAIAVTTAFLPTEQWLQEHEYLLAPGERTKFVRGAINPAVLQAIRNIRKTGRSVRGRPQRG